MTARYRYFSVKVDRFDALTIGAHTPAAARWEAFSRFREPYPDVTFRQFLAVCRVAACPAPEADGYDYVRRNYDVDVRLGQRVRLKDENSLTGREGEVVYPGVSTAHVHVLLDGEHHVSRVHPLNVERVQ